MNKKMYRLMSLIVAFVLTFAGYYQAQASATLAPLTSAVNYYVSTTGNDASTCTQTAPCKTIKKAISVAQNGDTILVSAGVYREYVYVDKSVALISNGATIDGVNASGSVTDGLVSVVASNAKVQGFTISNAKNYGLANFGNNSQFSNNIIHHTQGAGIWMRDGKFNTFEGNELYYTVLQNSVSFDGTSYTCNPNATSWPSAINSWGAAGSNIWRANNVHDNCGEGTVVYSGDLVENNTFKNNWSIEIYIVADKAIVRNNTIVDTKPYTPHGSDQSWRSVPAGITIGDEEVCLTDNNTITGNRITGSRFGISFYAYIACSGVKNSLIENNNILNTWEYGLRILAGAHANSTIRNNTVQLTSAKPLTIQNGGIAMTGNILFSNINLFEWNGKSYDFAAWNNVVPGNSWATGGQVVEVLGDTIGVFRPSVMAAFLKTQTPGFSDTSLNFGITGDSPVMGDWDGNGTDTIGVYRGGVFYLRNSNSTGAAHIVFAFGGLPGDQPVAGDWDGDGIDTIGLYRGSTSTFYLRNSNSTGAADTTFVLGNPGDIGIAGDWNGDGMDTTGVFRPSNGVIFLKNTNTSGFANEALNYGLPGDKPVMGDWNNDGIDTIGVYRDDKFLLRNSNTNGFAEIVLALGVKGDIPLAGNWDGHP